MPYKTLLVHVDESRHLDVRVEIAARLAVAQQAHLIGVATTGIPSLFYQPTIFGPGNPSVALFLETMQQRANAALQQFDNIVRRVGVASAEKRLTDDDAAHGVSLQGRCADLVVIGQTDPDEPSATVDSSFPEFVVMTCGCPTLVIPYASLVKTIGAKILVAWNGSREAARAVHSAIPLLKLAKTVEVALFNPEEQGDLGGVEPGEEIARYLARHNIKADVMEETIESDVGDALLSLAANLSSDLLVMGCYGHSRFREVLMGGVSRKVFDSMTLPVLMVH